MPVAFGGEKGRPTSRLRNFSLQFESLTDLLVLKLYKLIICISVGVICCKDLEGFMVAILRNEPSGRLGHPPQTNELDSREETLEETRNAPAPVIVYEKESKSHDSRNNGTPEPDRLEKVGNVGTVLWVSDLRGQWRSCCLRKP